MQRHRLLLLLRGGRRGGGRGRGRSGSDRKVDGSHVPVLVFREELLVVWVDGPGVPVLLLEQLAAAAALLGLLQAQPASVAR